MEHSPDPVGYLWQPAKQEAVDMLETKTGVDGGELKGMNNGPFDLLAVLRSRAADLRLMATSIRTPLSNTYRRRAAELELQAAAMAAALGLAERPVCVATVAA